MDSKFKKIAAFWRKDREDGTFFLSGKDNDGNKVFLFKNKFKNPDDPADAKKPDWEAFIADPLPAYNPQGPQTVIAAVQAPQPVAPPVTYSQPPFMGEDDIPF